MHLHKPDVMWATKVGFALLLLLEQRYSLSFSTLVRGMEERCNGDYVVGVPGNIQHRDVGDRGCICTVAFETILVLLTGIEGRKM